MAAGSRAYWFRSGFFTLLERFALQVFGMGTVMILLRAFETQKETYGVWVLYAVVASFVEVSRNGLIQNAKVKFLNAASREDYRRINTASATLNGLLTLFIGALLLLTAPLLSRWLQAPGLDKLISIYVATNIVLAPFIQFTFLQQANFRFQGTFYANVVRQGLFFVFVAATYFSGKTLVLENLAWAQFGTACAGSIVAWWYARPFIRYSRQLDWAWFRKLFNFGAFTFGTSMSTMLYKSIDRFMLGILMPTQALAMQAVALLDPAMRITNVMEIPVQAMAAIAYPQSAKRMKTDGRYAVKLLYEKSVGAVLALLLPLCLVVLLFPGFFIRVLAGSGDAYAGAIPILQVTILYTLFVPFGRQFGTTLDSMGKPYWSFVFVLTSALCNVVSNYFFIQAYGVIGAAYGTLLTLFLKFVAQQIILHRLLAVQTHRTLFYASVYYGEAMRFALAAFRDPHAALEQIKQQRDKKSTTTALEQTP